MAKIVTHISEALVAASLSTTLSPINIDHFADEDSVTISVQYDKEYLSQHLEDTSITFGQNKSSLYREVPKNWISDSFLPIFDDVPEGEWAKLPPDMASKVDENLYD